MLRLLHGGQPAGTAPGPVELHLVVADAVDPSPSVIVAYDVGAGWVPAAVARAGDEYVASLPGFADGTEVRLRFAAADASGNQLVHLLEPAYRVRWRRTCLPLVLKGP